MHHVGVGPGDPANQELIVRISRISLTSFRYYLYTCPMSRPIKSAQPYCPWIRSLVALCVDDAFVGLRFHYDQVVEGGRRLAYILH